MTDHDHESDRSPEHEEVRRLLADARHDDPVPAAVAARLERVLADLAEAPATRPNPRPVTSLATRRRRVAQLLVAAAAVAVVGIGVGQVLDGNPGSQDDMSSADAGADQDVPAAEGNADGSAPEKPGDTGAQESAPPATAAGRDEVVELSSSTFAQGVRDTAQGYLLDALVPQDLDRRTALLAACSARSWGAGAFVPVRYDGSPGVLVFRRPSGDTQVADLFLCGSREPVRSVTLPAG